VNKDNIFELFAKDIINCAKEISSKINSNEVLVAVGGDNIVFLAVFVADRIRFKDRSIGIIDFDTHGDIHLRGTSPTGNIHGMYLRPIFDKFDIECVDEVVPNKLSGRDLMYFGNFDFEKEERDFLDHQKIPQFTKQDLRLEIDRVKSSLNNFLSNHDHILINFDIDVLDKTLAPATGIPTENGLIFSEIEEILSLINNHKSKTIVLSEINPEKDGIDATVLSAERVISAML
jgi:arginase